MVLTSWVLNYLPAADQTTFVDRLDSIGARHDLSWIALESPGLCPGVPFPDEDEDRPGSTRGAVKDRQVIHIQNDVEPRSIF